MSNIALDFTNGINQGDTFELECVNHSSVPWTFYIYQEMPNQPSDVFSLAWFASPIVMAPGARINFKWEIDYSFVWSLTGVVRPGIRFDAGTVIPCSPTGNNQTTFSVPQNTPQFTPAAPGGQAGSLTVRAAGDVPNLRYATGIGISGQGAFVKQALANVTQVYTHEPKYFIAAGQNVQMGQVLAEQVTDTAEFVFPQNVRTLYAELDSQQQWNISETPFA